MTGILQIQFNTFTERKQCRFRKIVKDTNCTQHSYLNIFFNHYFIFILSSSSIHKF